MVNVSYSTNTRLCAKMVNVTDSANIVSTAVVNVSRSTNTRLRAKMVNVTDSANIVLTAVVNVPRSTNTRLRTKICYSLSHIKEALTRIGEFLEELKQEK